MILPSASDCLDRKTSSAESRPIGAPLGLVADGRSALRPARERLVTTMASAMPVLGWKIPQEQSLPGTSAFEVEVRDSSGQIVWRSGTVTSADTEIAIARELSAHSRYEWRVRVAAHDGRWSPWADSSLETGPLVYADWQARWLSIAHRSRVVTRFHLSRPVVEARLHFTAQGLARAFVNEAAVNSDRIDPTRTDFVRALYRSYDVTDLLDTGENTLGFVMGLGEWARTAQPPRLLAELVIRHEDGSVTWIAPGVDSEVTMSEIAVDEPFYLERHDARAPVDEAAPPHAPIIVEPMALPTTAATPPTDVSADPTPALRTIKAFVPQEIGRSEGSRRFDIGANIAGRSRLVLREGVPEGTVIQVLHGEHIGEDGHIDTTNLTMPYDHGRDRQLVEYVSGGVAGETHEPWFAYFGFRYLEIRGLPENSLVTVSAHSMHTDLTPSGSVTTDSRTIDRLLVTASRTLLNNVHGVPEDCPTREQAAWTGDTASVAEYELAAFDSAAFLDKWIADLETSQQADGQLPAVSPDLHASRMPSDPVWGSALHRMLLGHLLHYGDERVVKRALPALRRWADFQLGCIDADGVVSLSPISYGHDWLALEQTPPPIHHTGAVIDCLLALAELEDAIGDPDAAARRRLSADSLRASARRAFFDPTTGTFGNGSQGSYAIAVEAGILNGQEAVEAGDRLVGLIRQRGNRVSSGFATTRSVVRALTRLNRSQVVYDILLQPEEPGVGAMLNSGPGTFWECWWIDPANTGTGSLNHVGLGGPFAAWAWEGLAGLRPTAPGYTRFRVAPQLIEGVRRLELRTETVRGEIAIAYTRLGGSVHIEITVPPGTEGVLATADLSDVFLSPGKHVLDIDEPEGRSVGSPPASASMESVTPVAADVAGSRNLLAESDLSPGRAHPDVRVVEGLVCMPIPHEQPDHPVLRIVADVNEPGETAPTVIARLRTPLALSGISFVYALIDQCLAGPERDAMPLLVLHLSNGETRRSTSTAWPAGWNRVAVDTVGLADHLDVVAIEVGLTYGDDAAENALAVYPRENGLPAGFHLGEVGFSTLRRTW
ncbi:family 78 glycoside hydrolase catalytic domain [Humibacter sp. RRB41]|uniref:family 78 glycoside hydrolase catalytic domain n=1 Tax=Humibacter sp. RRB41 TaxID=2919946 RepID=UPI001FAAD5C7|nr:family 78 glycoside hydrolase catalytic domain [Humibacter sp. RRB41]